MQQQIYLESLSCYHSGFFFQKSLEKKTSDFTFCSRMSDLGLFYLQGLVAFNIRTKQCRELQTPINSSYFYHRVNEKIHSSFQYSKLQELPDEWGFFSTEASLIWLKILDNLYVWWIPNIHTRLGPEEEFTGVGGTGSSCTTATSKVWLTWASETILESSLKVKQDVARMTDLCQFAEA